MFIPNIVAYPFLLIIGYVLLKSCVRIISALFFKRIKVGYSRNCLITGGSRGIGYELGKLFLEDEYNLLIAARNVEQLRISTSELKEMFPKSEILFFQVDLSSSDGVKKLIGELKSKKISVDVLVNNAGRYILEYFEKVDIEDHVELIMLNNLSNVRLTHFVLSGMIERKFGKILNVGSFSSYSNAPRISTYVASKFFIRGFSLSLNLEMKLKHPYIQITSMNPGFVKTKLLMDSGFENSWSAYSPLMSAEQAAFEGYRALLLGENEVLMGFLNKFLVFGKTFFFPNWFSDFIMNVGTKPKNE